MDDLPSRNEQRPPLRPLHRARGFFTALVPRKLTSSQRDWIRSQLSDREYELFNKMSMVDQVHSYRVAQLVLTNLGHEVNVAPEHHDWMIAAALLHDVGKTVANLGTFGRVMATLSISAGGKDMGEHWARTRGMTRRIGLYAMYPQLGSDLLSLAGSDPRVATWAREHHGGEGDWSVPKECGRVLARADDAA